MTGSGRPPISEGRLAAICGALVALGPVSMAVYTPAMPALVAHFDTTQSVIQLSLMAYFATFALAQLVCGPLSDSFGRRPTVIWFMALYVGGSLIALGPGVEWLIAGRTIQGVGAAAGVTVARAMVRDLYTGPEGVRLMSLIGLVLGIGPAIAPTFGGVALELAGWQGVFAIMIAHGGGLLLLFVLAVPETSTRIDPASFRPRRISSGYATLLTDPRVLAPTIVLGTTLGLLYAISTMLPFVLIDAAGLSPIQFGFAMMLQTGPYIAGSLAMRTLARRVRIDVLARVGLALVVTAAAAIALTTHLAEPSVATIMGPIAVFALGLSFVQPAITTEILAPHPHLAGAASALIGFTQMGSAFAGAAIAATMPDPTTALGTIMPVMAGIGLAAYLASRRT